MTFLTQIGKIRNFLVTSVLAVSLGGIFFLSGQVLASTYGSGNYDTCKYGTSCPSTPTSGPTSTNASPTTDQTSGQILLNDFSEFFTDAGKQLELSKGQIVYFDVTTDGTTQRKSITIVDVTDSYVDLLITLDSVNLKVRMNIGDTKQYDVNNDGKDDIQITLDSITNGKATLTFKAVLGASVTQPSTTNPTATTVPTATKGKSWWIGLIVSIALIVIAAFIFIILKRRRRKNQDGPFGPTPPAISPQPPINQLPPSTPSPPPSPPNPTRWQ